MPLAGGHAMRFICAPQHLIKLAESLEAFMSPIGFVMSKGEYLSLAARMLGHSDFNDFLESVGRPDRNERLFHIEESRKAGVDQLRECHTLALELAGLSIDEAEEFVTASIADEQWVRGIRPLP
jgi:hypothetical protein